MYELEATADLLLMSPQAKVAREVDLKQSQRGKITDYLIDLRIYRRAIEKRQVDCKSRALAPI